MTAQATRVRQSRTGRSNGQWAVDGREPLNHNEEFKAEDNGLNVRERIEKVYAREGFDAIPADDLHGRFRWWGLYTQRKPGIDGGRTAQLEPHELEDRFFMLRVRSDGELLSPAALAVLGSISTDFARGTADITDRQNIQYHWISVEDMPEIWRRLETVGLETTEACGDTPRGFLGSPVAGVAADEIIDPTPVIAEIKRRYLGDPELANLPRKFKSAITGHPSLDVAHEINDVSLVGVVHPELGPGYDLWVGGALSTTPRLAERLGTFVTAEQAPDVWHGVIRIFRDYGYRRLRTKARLKFLLAEWGTEKFREVLENEYLGYRLADGPAPARATSPGDHVGVHEQKDGRSYVGAAPVVGRVSGSTLTDVGTLVERVGASGVRLTAHQKLVVLDVPSDRVEELVEGLEAIGLSTRPSPFRRNTVACTGIEFCKLAIVDTKDTAAATIAELEQRLAGVELDTPISLHVNGCPNSCARIQTADIGLKGQIITTDDGEQVPGFQVHLGGGLASDDREEGGLGRTVRGLKVAAADLPDYVERVVRRFLAERDGTETFATWAHRADEEALQ
ncbi:sulfite reductase (ferredoxin) [Barrientosiimonas humi]|uniref:assimilatory sulfite reductase (ferredoxin) n=1 Tax=Barrientosiimonas humi TaxID=999931 RepID=A0A542XFG9_9MICO|nr:nitrite/sulfite reductase [Barrientosiimonas humi]TQL34570.1 sulfite reductase (ferredoxin) [Barrientosiimonas humi]CAG7574560.1 Sulfite reductase [ferredoxin] [Barrientosiimonas humi]